MVTKIAAFAYFIGLFVLTRQQEFEPQPPNDEDGMLPEDVMQPTNGPPPYLSTVMQPVNGPASYLNEEDRTRLYSGDIKLTDDDIRSLREKACMESADLMWPKEGKMVRIPYAIYSLGQKGRDLMPKVAKEYKRHTCISLEEVHTYNPEYELAVVNYGGCASWMGKKNFSDGYQVVNLSPNCENFGTMLHEFGHAIGLFHEHERPDRDQYISFDLTKVKPDQRFNYDLSNCNTAGTEYDLTSIMHYDYKGFSAEGRMVIGVKQIDQQYLLGLEKNELSHRDKVTINKLYGCLDDWKKKCNITKNPCQNDGYIHRSCKCVCPKGTKGKHCEKRVGPYYPVNPLSCGGNITSEQTISHVPGGKVGNCIWLITAPAGKIVRLEIEDIQLIDDCYSITLTVRWQDKYLGDTYCFNSEISRGSYYDSVGDTMVVQWENKYPHDYGKFKGRIRFL